MDRIEFGRFSFCAVLPRLYQIEENLMLSYMYYGISHDKKTSQAGRQADRHRQTYLHNYKFFLSIIISIEVKRVYLKIRRDFVSLILLHHFVLHIFLLLLLFLFFFFVSIGATRRRPIRVRAYQILIIYSLHRIAGPKRRKTTV